MSTVSSSGDAMYVGGVQTVVVALNPLAFGDARVLGVFRYLRVVFAVVIRDSERDKASKHKRHTYKEHGRVKPVVPSTANRDAPKFVWTVIPSVVVRHGHIGPISIANATTITMQVNATISQSYFWSGRRGLMCRFLRLVGAVHRVELCPAKGTVDRYPFTLAHSPGSRSSFVWLGGGRLR